MKKWWVLELAALAAAVVLASCAAHDDDPRSRRRLGVRAQAAVELPRQCERDPDEIREMIEEDSGRPCAASRECPCGSYCFFVGAHGKCQADCVARDDPDYGCSGQGTICDNWGQCTVPITDPDDQTTSFVQEVSPLTVVLARTPPAGGFGAKVIDVRLKVRLPTSQPAPTVRALPVVRVTAGTDLQPGCMDDDPQTPCSDENASSLGVSCTAANTFERSCVLSQAAWTRTSRIVDEGRTEHVFSTVVRAKPRADASLETAPWELHIDAGAGVGDHEATVAFTRAQPAPYPGHYRGELTIAADPAATFAGIDLPPFTIPLEAHATQPTAPLYVVDRTQAISPTGSFRLASDSETKYALDTVSVPGLSGRALIWTEHLTHDPEQAAITGDVLVGLEGEEPLRHRLVLRRTSETPVSCSAQADCATLGLRCDSSLGVCVPGDAPADQELHGSFSALRAEHPFITGESEHVNAWIQAGRSVATEVAGAALVSADYAERLMCSPSNEEDGDPNESLHLSSTLLQESQDLECANGMLPYTGRVAALPSGTVEHMLTSCITELTSTSPVASSECLGRDRIAAALSALAPHTALGNRREGALSLHLVSQWAKSLTFLAQQSREIWRHDRVDDVADLDLDQAMAALREGFSLLLDPRIREQFLTASLGARDPDYRPSRFPRAAFARNATRDAVEGIQLSPRGGGGWHEATLRSEQLDLSGDMTCAFDIRHVRPITVKGPTLIESAPFTVSYHSDSHAQFHEGALFERNPPSCPTNSPSCATHAVSTNFESGNSWLACWESCVEDDLSGGCRAWQYNEEPGVDARGRPNPACTRFYTNDRQLIDTVPARQAKWKAGFVPRERLQTRPMNRWLTDTSFYGTPIDTVDLRNWPADPLVECQRYCAARGSSPDDPVNTTYCTHATYNPTTKICSFFKGMPLVKSQAGVRAWADFRAWHWADDAQVMKGAANLTAAYATTTTTDWGQCYNRCQRDQACGGWSFNRATRVCSLAGGWSFRASSDAISGRVPRQYIQVRHQAVDGSHFEWRAPIDRGGHFLSPDTALTIVRDALAREYRIYRGSALIASTVYPEEQRPVQLATYTLGAVRGMSNADPAVGQLVFFESALDGKRVAEVQATLRGTVELAPSLTDSDHSVGPAVHILEALEQYLLTVREHGRLALGASLDRCRSTEGSEIQRRAAATVAEALRIATAVQELVALGYQAAHRVRCLNDEVCAPYGASCDGQLGDDGWGSCATSAGENHFEVPWRAEYEAALAATLGARLELANSLSALARCENPLGISESDLPLYFPPEVDGYFASSVHMLDLASDAVGAVDHDLDELRAAALGQRQAELSAAQDATPQQVSASYDGDLALLCGDAGYDMLSMFGPNRTLTPSTCFIEQTMACLAQDIERASPQCFRGSLGTAILDMQIANLRVATMTRNVRDLEAAVERRSELCTLYEDASRMRAEHNEYVRQMRLLGGLLGQASNLLALGSKKRAGDAAELLAELRKRPETEQFVAGYLELTSDAAAMGVGAGHIAAISSLFSFWLGSEQSAFDRRIEAIEDEAKGKECRDELMGKRSELRRAQDALLTEARLYDRAALVLANGVNTVRSIVSRGNAAVAREESRSIRRPEHHYWVNELTAQFQGDLARAIRMSYLAARAVEYESQERATVRGRILTARSPGELRSALQVLASYGTGTGRVCGAFPDRSWFVVPLSALMGIHDDGVGHVLDDSEKAELRSRLGSRTSWYVDRQGQVLGSAVRFELRPNIARGWTNAGLISALERRAGERIKAISVVAATELSASRPSNWVEIRHRDTFASQFCSAEAGGGRRMQEVGIRPSRNLLLDDAAGSHSESTTFSIAMPTVLYEEPAGFDSLEVPTWGVDTALRGRGLYGEYWLIIPPDIDVSQLTDLKVRFDYESVAMDPDFVDLGGQGPGGGEGDVGGAPPAPPGPVVPTPPRPPNFPPTTPPCQCVRAPCGCDPGDPGDSM